MDASDTKLEVQVRAGGPPRGADGTDQIALLDALALDSVASIDAVVKLAKADGKQMDRQLNTMLILLALAGIGLLLALFARYRAN